MSNQEEEKIIEKIEEVPVILPILKEIPREGNFRGADRGNDKVGFVANVSRAAVHGDGECPLIRTF